jgi:uncharacterized membrane protein
MDDQVLLRFFGRLHPLVVHFPIALVLVATLIEAGLSLRGRHRVSTTALTCLVFGAIMAAVAAWFGWLNAANESFGSAQALTILLHRWIGIAAAGLALAAVALGFCARGGQTRWTVNAYRGLLIIAAMLVAIGGHFGAELVYGQDYLVSVFRSSPPAQSAPAAVPTAPRVVAGSKPSSAAVRRIDFASEVQPILVEHCVHCHGSQRQRGGLVLVPIEATLARTGDGRVILPQDPDASPIMQRIRLPGDHPDLMPADDDPLPAEKIAILAQWIEQGATVLPPAQSRFDVAIGSGDWSIELDRERLAARDRIIDAIAARGGLAVPVAADTHAIDVNLGVASPPVHDDDLVLLTGLEDCLVQLNLSRSGVTDEGLENLAAMQELRRLRLDHTSVTSSGMAHLDGLEQLIDLNLYGTQLGDAGLEVVVMLPRLERLYVGNTRVSEAGVQAMRLRRPEVHIVREPALLSPPAAVPETDDP